MTLGVTKIRSSLFDRSFVLRRKNWPMIGSWPSTGIELVLSFSLFWVKPPRTIVSLFRTRATTEICCVT